MAKVSTNITLDPNLKREAVELFSKFGLDLSTAITLFLQQSVREKRIPFAISLEIPNKETREALGERKGMKTDKKKYKRYDSFSQIVEEVK